MSFALSSHRTYFNGQERYKHFCRLSSLQPYPIVEDTLRLFVTSLASSVGYNTIKTYLAAVKHKHVELGFPTNHLPMNRLNQLLRGIKRAHWVHVRLPRPPVSVEVLKTLKASLRSAGFCAEDKLMLWAAFTLAYFGFLRSAEFCSPAEATYCKLATLQWSDVSISRDQVIVSINSSKSDQFKNGCKVHLAATGNSICLARALTKYARSTQNACGPFFTFENGKLLTRKRFTAITKSLLATKVEHSETYSFHCF